MSTLNQIKVENTLYDIEDKGAREELANKQDKLVSGQNIKTINGEDILGEGDIEIQGSREVIWETVVEKTLEGETTIWTYEFEETDELLFEATGFLCNNSGVSIDMYVNIGALSTLNGGCVRTEPCLHNTAPLTFRAHVKAIDDGLFLFSCSKFGGLAATINIGNMIQDTGETTRKINKIAIAAASHGINRMIAGTFVLKRRKL